MTERKKGNLKKFSNVVCLGCYKAKKPLNIRLWI